MILTAVHAAAQRALEAFVLSSGYEFQSEIARASFAKGQAQGQAQGQALRAAEDILDILDARGLVPTEEQRIRILASTDLEELRRWVRRAATVAKLEDLFAD